MVTYRTVSLSNAFAEKKVKLSMVAKKAIEGFGGTLWQKAGA